MSNDPFGDIIDDIGSGVATIMMYLMVSAMIALGFLLVAAAWLVISAGIAWIEHRKLLDEAQDIFDRAREEAGSKLQIDPLLVAIFGPELDLPVVGADHDEEWLTEAIFGVSE